MHGLAQSEAVTRAAQTLSREELNYERAVASGISESVATARHNLGVARAVYRAAYKAYTNPFGIQKTFS